MKLLQLSFLFGLLSLLCQIADASIKCESWSFGVNAHYEGVYNANKDLRGTVLDRSKSIKVLREYIDKLAYYTKVDSEILSTSSTATLMALSRCQKLFVTGWNIITQFEKVYPAMIADFKAIITKLCNHLGHLTCTVLDAITNVGRVFSNYMKEILKIGRWECREEVDAKSVLQQLEIFANIVARISNEALHNCDSTQENRDSALALNLIALIVANAVQGITKCQLQVLHEQKCPERQNSVQSCSLPLDNALARIIQVIKASIVALENTIK